MPAPIDDSSVAFLRSDGRMPAHAAILTGTTQRALAPTTMPADLPVSQLVEPQAVTFTAVDGLTIRGQVFVPADIKSGERRPAVLFFHGGSRRQMLLAWHYLAYYHNTYAMNQYLASRGYVVLSVNYRSGTGYGLEFREALNYGATGASEFNDVLGAGLYMKQRRRRRPHANWDLWRFVRWLPHGTRACARVGLVCGWGGHSRCPQLERWHPDVHPDVNPSPEIERRNFNSSPLAFIDDWRSPVLLVHGDDDRNVSFAETVTLAEHLRKRNVTFEQLVLPDEIHGFLRYDSWLQVFRASADFFDRHLRSKRPTN